MDLKSQVRDVARGLIGALLLGMPLLFTMEVWWLGWRLPAPLLLGYSVGGLVAVSLAVHWVGFHEGRQEQQRGFAKQVGDFCILFMTSFVAAVLVLALFGVIDSTSTLSHVVRLALMQVVPLGLGAAITNRALKAAEEDDPPPLRREAAIYALGVLFFALPVAPTEEMELLAAHAGAWRMPLIVIASFLLSYVALYVIEFRGHGGRSEAAQSWGVQVGETAVGYVIAFALSAALLAGFGHFTETTLPMAVQQTVVLAFLGCIGGSAARVVI